jgi:hypothetical protein
MSKEEVLRIKFVFGCINCDKPIPLKIANTGKQICCIKCLNELNKGQPKKYHFQKSEVWE